MDDIDNSPDPTYRHIHTLVDELTKIMNEHVVEWRKNGMSNQDSGNTILHVLVTLTGSVLMSAIPNPKIGAKNLHEALMIFLDAFASDKETH